MKYITLLYLFFSSLITYSQTNTITTDFNSKSIDSIQLSVWEINNKETSSVGVENISYYEKKLKEVTLNKNDEKIFLKRLNDSTSYDNSRVLLNHFDVVLNIYQKGVVSTEIKCSTITENINIESKLTDDSFKNNYSSKMKKTLSYLLKRYDMFKSTYFSK